MEIKEYTQDRIPDVLEYERDLRREEDFWGWAIDDAYVAEVKASFRDQRFQNAVSYLAYLDGRVVGRIDASLITSRFCGQVRAYLDWLCVLKSCRHLGVAQALMAHLRTKLKETYHAQELVGLIAANPEAQRFYRSLENAQIRDEGIWIEL
ncbi:MAG: GNAT family N-acetyltransferase [Eubacteriales bacterium]|nr:GNAT family N-acetyltransferase [Eubacteriales bacterium]